jgi:hypothetical protein
VVLTDGSAPAAVVENSSLQPLNIVLQVVPPAHALDHSPHVTFAETNQYHAQGPFNTPCTQPNSGSFSYYLVWILIHSFLVLCFH